ncbi:MAG: hypothetical protein KatS3mg100_412 [Candidatus Parcubacteria bacterium]|nr:MAG: hypothetical protein KatS3mg100_412 [Candidatus Parcubacteria bacterium]
MRHTTHSSFWLMLVEAAVALGLSAALVAGGFAFVNWWLPDPTNPWTIRAAPDSLRFAMAMLFVLAPLWWLVRRTREKIKEIHPAHWWIIGALAFLSAIVLAGDAITLLYQWFSGELTGRVGAKITWLGLVAGGALALYGGEMRAGAVGGDFVRKAGTFARAGVMALVVFVVVAGFASVGSPSYARNLRYDELRENALRELVWRIQSYALERGSLPASLSDVLSSAHGDLSLEDPETGDPFDYKTLSESSFELCAVFALPSPLTRACGEDQRCRRLVGEDDISLHSAGKWCVTRTIDAPLKDGSPRMPALVPLRD